MRGRKGTTRPLTNAINYGLTPNLNVNDLNLLLNGRWPALVPLCDGREPSLDGTRDSSALSLAVLGGIGGYVGKAVRQAQRLPQKTSPPEPPTYLHLCLTLMESYLEERMLSLGLPTPFAWYSKFLRCLKRRVAECWGTKHGFSALCTGMGNGSRHFTCTWVSIAPDLKPSSQINIGTAANVGIHCSTPADYLHLLLLCIVACIIGNPTANLLQFCWSRSMWLC